MTSVAKIDWGNWWHSGSRALIPVCFALPNKMSTLLYGHRWNTTCYVIYMYINGQWFSRFNK